jgi:hypothetical protein
LFSHFVKEYSKFKRDSLVDTTLIPIKVLHSS